ncbi:hypothetical protein HJ01_02383 [Flavobacterium frigoris PS1]|uniref:Uncharacterized protein n=2 Tax=Flavobacterium frigoris TaxID=229204 RepID=H7FSV2_FLAFP|nr:hypothetical protein HJ01_02383 [Flavobacterium frigoris PS1]
MKTIKWNKSKTALIELIYALHAQKTFNNGKIDIAEMANYFEKIFDITYEKLFKLINICYQN